MSSPGGEPDYAVVVDRGAPRTVVAVSGELDLATVDDFAAVLRAELSAAPVLLDLQAVSFMDSSGVRVLDALLRDMAPEGWDLQISSDLAPNVRQVLAMTGMLGVLPMRQDDATT